MKSLAMRSALLAGALSLGSSPAFAQEADEAVSEDDPIIVEGERPEEDPIICKKTRPPTASRISRSKKVCKPNSQWVAEAEEAKQLSDDFAQDEMRRSQIEMSNAMNDQRSGGISPR
ncbi:hypothetical protein [Qipengyuania vesicularis]|uniref:hypothetical protein n=1 Tax=Qipengyuania vesicularis TaxID=2867232 RepID=UPI001C882FDD|nr:hypothetical protein [Qipengyuania vesicularis]MBX7526696.1 hypothetical protein [Qipengyuania vesicularis]